jgi:hypothetical protein
MKELIANADPLRITQSLNGLSDGYNAAIPWVTPYGPALMFLCVVLLIILLSKHRNTIVTFLSRPGRPVKKFFEGRRMRKEREAMEQADLQECLIDRVEDNVEAGRWTRRRANIWYAKLYKIFPELRRCIQDQTPEERMRDAQSERERDAEGNVIPMPLPGGESKKTAVG